MTFYNFPNSQDKWIFNLAFYDRINKNEKEIELRWHNPESHKRSKSLISYENNDLRDIDYSDLLSILGLQKESE